jgi:Big-like domain-containing protein/beta-propeller repeat-containing protein
LITSQCARLPGHPPWRRRLLKIGLQAGVFFCIAVAALSLQAGEPATPPHPPVPASKSHRSGPPLRARGIQSPGSAPALSYATYLGSPKYRVDALAVGPDGTAYVAGVALASAADIDLAGTRPGEGTAFVARISNDGSQLIYFTFLGTDAVSEARAIAVDASGNAYVTGQTRSKTFPVIDALQSGCSQNVSGQCAGDAFVAKLNTQGSIIYSTYLGGSGEDAGNAISIDASENIYVAGTTTSTDFPTFKPAQSSIGGDQDAFIVKISADGSHLVFATYLGGNGDDESRGIAVDATGNIFVTGSTASTDFPVHNALQSSCVLNSKSLCPGEAFVAKLSADGSTFLYSTYLGGSGGDAANAVTIDPSGSVYITGVTNSADFPVLRPLEARATGGGDAFVSRLSADGKSLVFSTYLGGAGANQGNAITLDQYGNVFVSGWTSSLNFPTFDPVQSACRTDSQGACSVDVFVAAMDSMGATIKFATYLGGSGVDDARGIAVDAQGAIYIAGETTSVDFPEAKLVQPSKSAGNQSPGGAFAAKISGVSFEQNGGGTGSSATKNSSSQPPDPPTACTGTTTNWLGGTGNWSNAAMWSTGVVPNSTSTNVCIDDGNAADSVVTLDIAVSVGTLTIDSGDSLTIGNNQTLVVAGNISNAGQILISAAANNTFLSISGAVSLSGGGTLTMSMSGGGVAVINESGSGAVLTNVDNTIQGRGQIGNNGLSFINQTAGIVNGNAAGAALLLNTNSIANQGLLESTSAFLQISTGTNNSGGTISASGTGVVQFLSGATIQGGTLSSAGGGVLGVASGITATLDGATHGTLTISGTYTGPNNSTTILVGTINNTGAILVNAAANNTFLSISAGVSLTGGGTVTLSTTGGGVAVINESGSGAILTNTNNIIQGVGQIGNNGLALVNQASGIIDANIAGAALLLNSNGVTNLGLLEATNGGVLQTSTSVNNLNATITANGTNSTVQFLNGTTVQAGTLSTLNGGILGVAASQTATLDGTTHGALINAGTYTGPNNSTTVLLGTINNAGAIQVVAAANNTFLSISGNVSLTGAGTVTLSTSGGGTAVINESGGGAVLTNVSNTIQGFGQIGNNGLALVNQSTINANQPAGVLLINANSLTNQGLLEASAGGTMQPSLTISNAAGMIEANGSTSSMQFLNGTSIQGGTITTTNSGVLGVAANQAITLDGTTHGALTNSGTYVAANNSTTILIGTINNPGLIQVNATANNTFLSVSGNVSLTGAGTLTLSTAGGGIAIINESGGGGVLTNVNNTIQGSGQIGNNGLALLNQGTINASQLSTTLTLNPSGITNPGLLEATAGTLVLANSILNNAGGNIKVSGASSSVQFVNGATIQGGTLTSAGGGVMGVAANNTITLDGNAQGPLTIVGTYTGANNSTTVVVGTIINTGTILISAAANNTFLSISGAVSLSGGGTVTMSMSGGGVAVINESGSGAVLTNVDTIQGSGQIGNNGLALINQGTINASQAGTALVINPVSTTNAGLLEATAGTLQLAISVVNNAAGTIKVAGAASSVQFVSGATIQGGTLATASGGVLGVAANTTITLDGATHGALTISGAYTGPNNSTTILVGTINNAGAILVNAAANNTFLSISAGVILTGGGTVTLSTTGGGIPIINESGSGATLTNANNTIQGVGQIGNNGLALVNQASGIIDANVAGAALLLNSNGVTNLGLLEATSGGVLQTSTSVNNLSATITANGTNSTVQFLNGTTVQAGTLSTLNGGILGVAASQTATLDGTTHGALINAGTYTGPNNSTTVLLGTINNAGAIQVVAAANNTFLSISGNVSLTGAGTVTLSTSGGGTPVINESGSNGVLTNVTNTIQGIGQIGNNGLTLVNQSTINANQPAGVLTINPNSLTNQGLLETASGAASQITNGAIANAGGTIKVDGSMGVPAGFTVNGGTLSGSGTISGSVVVGPSAITQPGDIPLPGVLTISGSGAGNYTQGPTDALNVVIGGTTPGTQYSQLKLTGAANLNGAVNVSLVNGFTPAAGTQFTILSAASVTGQFSTPSLPGLPAGLLWTVTYNPTSVVLVAAAPASIAVTPANASIAVNATLQFTATATFASGSTQNITGAVTWGSSTPVAATITSTGLATGVTGGQSTTISATLGSVMGSTGLTVTSSGTPALTQVSPNTGGQGQQNLSIAITGQATHFAQATTTASFGSGITVVSLTVNSATSATAVINIAQSAPLGARTVTLTSGGEVASLTNGFTVTALSLTSIAVTPNPAPSIAIGATEQFTATGTFSDGSTQNLTSTATWASSNSGFASISNTAGTRGLATGVAVGMTSINASVNGVTSPGVSLTVTATAPTLTSITVAPLTMSIAVGATQTFTATGHFSDGSSGAVTVNWTSSNNAIATINAAGVASGVSAGGPITIKATSTQTPSINGTAQLTVTAAAPTLTSITVAPLTMSIAIGATQTFTATGHFSDGSSGAVTVNWTSSNNAIATINAAGVASGVSAGGPITIKATSTQTPSINGTAQLTVTAAVPTLTSITVAPLTMSIAVGATQTFTATGHFSDGSSGAVTVNWTSSNNAIATINAAGVASGVSAGGPITIKATSTQTPSINGTAQLTVTAAPPTLTSITVAPLTASVAVGATQTFTATGHFSDGSSGAVTVNWTSSNNAIATVNAAGLASGVSAGGPITIKATSTQTPSINGTAQLTVTATAPTLTSITVAPLTMSIAVGATQTFTATGHFSDGSSGAVTVNWTSSNNAIATINAAGVASGVSAGGPITIKATSTQTPSINGTAQLTVTATAPTLTSITVAPLTMSIAVGATQTFTATGHFSDGSSGAVTVNWTSSNNAIATINAAGVASGVSAGGPITIKATSTQTPSINGTAQLTVTATALVSIAVTPANPSAAAGTTLQFHATGTYADTSTKDITTAVTWTSSNTRAATINAAGLATLIAVGQSTIFATLGTVSGNTLLTVSSAPFTLTLGPPPAGQPAVPTVTPGSSIAFGLVLTAAPNFSGTVQFACTTTNPTIICSPAPSSVTLSPTSPTEVAIVLNTFCQGAAASVPAIPGNIGAGFGLLLMSLVFGGAALSYRRRGTWALASVLLAMIALGSAACGGLPKGPNGATQPGPVFVTVTASANGTTATAPPIELIIK